MLTQRIEPPSRFTRADMPRLAIAAGILILALAAILGADILPESPLQVAEGQLATRDIVAPRALDFESRVQTDAARQAATTAVGPQYDFTTENAIAIAAAQQVAFEGRVTPIDTTFSADISPEGRKSLLHTALPDLSESAKTTLSGLDPAGWAAVRTEAARVLDATLRTELRDTEVAETRTRLSGRMAGGLDEAQRMLAAELISPLVVPNSSFSLDLTNQAATGRPRRWHRSSRRSARARSSSGTGRRCRLPTSRRSTRSASPRRPPTSRASAAGCSSPCSWS